MTMKARMWLAEAASIHQDGTVSMLRGGISVVAGQAPPISLQGAVLVRLEGEIGDQGKHAFDLRLMDEDGNPHGPKMTGEFEVPTAGGNGSFVLNFSTAFKKPGRFLYVLRVDNIEHDRWALTVALRQPKQQEQPPT